MGSAKGELQKQVPKAIPIWPMYHICQLQKNKFWWSKKLKIHFSAIYLHKQGRCSEHKTIKPTCIIIFSCFPDLDGVGNILLSSIHLSEIFQHVNRQHTKADRSVLVQSMTSIWFCLPGVLLLIAAVVLGKTGVTTGGGIPAAMSKRGWIISLLNTLFFCHKFSTLTILL